MVSGKVLFEDLERLAGGLPRVSEPGLSWAYQAPGPVDELSVRRSAAGAFGAFASAHTERCSALFLIQSIAFSFATAGEARQSSRRRPGTKNRHSDLRLL